MNAREFFEDWGLVLIMVGWFLFVALLVANDDWHRFPARAGVEVRQ